MFPRYCTALHFALFYFPALCFTAFCCISFTKRKKEYIYIYKETRNKSRNNSAIKFINSRAGIEKQLPLLRK
jgi:hypothetical protein